MPFKLDFKPNSIILLFHTSGPRSELMPGSERGHVHWLNKCKWRSCNSAGGFFYCPRHPPPPPLLRVLHPARLPVLPTQHAFRSSGSRDNKLDSLLVLRFIIVAGRRCRRLRLLRRPSASGSTQFQGECLFRVCIAVQCHASKRRELHSHLTRDRHE